MGKTHKHKICGKFNNGIDTDIPENIHRYWRRKNNDIGEFRSKKKKTLEKILDKELKSNQN